MVFSSTSSAVRTAARGGKRLQVALCTIGLAGLFTAGLLTSLRKPQTELPVYMAAAERLRHGEAIYRQEQTPFTYPPLFALPFVPMTYLPPQAQRPVWYLVNVSALVLIFWRLRRRLAPVLDQTTSSGWSRPPTWIFWVVLLVLAGRHVVSPLEYQSHDYLVFLSTMLAVDAWCSMRQMGAGLAAGLGTSLKATPLLFAPLFLWQRRWGALVALLVTVPALTVLPDWLYPARDGVSWSVGWYQTFLHAVRAGESPDVGKAWGAWNQLNQSLAGTLHRLFTPATPGLTHYDVNLHTLQPWALKLATLGSQLAIVVWLLWASRGSLTQNLPEGHRAFQRLGEGSAVVAAMVLLSPVSSKTHFCVLLLPLAFCVADFLYRRRDPLVGLMLLMFFALGTFTTKDLVGTKFGDHVLAAGSLTWCALALLIATGWVLLSRSRALRVMPRLADVPLVRKAAA